MPFGPLGQLLMGVIYFINAVLLPLILALAFLMFMWGVFNYFIAGGANEEKRQQGKDFVLWSVIAFFIIFSLWGIVNLLMNSLGFRSQNRPNLPTFGTPQVQQRSNQDLFGNFQADESGSISGNGNSDVPAGSYKCPAPSNTVCQNGTQCVMIADLGDYACSSSN